MERNFFTHPDYHSNQYEKVLLTSEETEKYLRLVEKAKEGKAYPYQSGYKVQAAALAEDGTMRAGGNKEFARSNAFVHGETSAIDGLTQETESPIEAIAWYLERTFEGPVSKDFARPCGNCRDVLLEYCGQGLHLLTGNQKGIVYMEFKDFLFDRFRKLETTGSKTSQIKKGIVAARSGNDIYLPDGKKKEIYGVVLISESGKTWTGSDNSNAGFDANPPVRCAVTNWRENYPKDKICEGDLRLSRLLIVGEKQLPNVLYRDRQEILELDEILRKFTKSSEPLKVEIIHTGADYMSSGIPESVYETDTEEWLPHPFTPGAFRNDDVMFGELGKLIGSNNLAKLKP